MSERFSADTLFTHWVIEMNAAHLSTRTVEERVRAVLQMARETGADPVCANSHEIAVWLSSKESAATQNTYFSHLNAWFMFLVRRYHRTDNPMELLNAAKRKHAVPRPIHRSDLLAVLSLPRLSKVTRDKILLGAYAGLRVHEIAKIRGQDVDLSAGKIFVKGKGRREDFIPLHPILLALAEDYPSGFWFPSPSDPLSHVTSRRVSIAISSAFARAGIRATAHQLRHYYATELLAGGSDVRVVQTLMRHCSLSTTAIYVKVSEEQQRTALDGLPKLPSLAGLKEL